MQRVFFIIALIITQSVSAQITLKECVESGLTSKGNIKSAKTELFLANLKSVESKAKYLPEISVAYDYRYNPVIASQIVPIGQFNSVPTDDKRAIQFGTNWQQNAGINLYQPIVDIAVRNRIRESKLNESLSSIDLMQSENDLTFEIVKTYSNIIIFGYQVLESISDTVRSYNSYAIINSKYKEGLVLKTELNSSLVNHNSNLLALKRASAALANEKIYLHYLSNLKLERILSEQFIPIPEAVYSGGDSVNIQPAATPDFQKLQAKQTLIRQQIKTERTNSRPTIGFQGYLGANHFSQIFDPFLANSWFGNSFVGLSVKVPILSNEKSINGVKQLQAQMVIVENQRAELLSEKSRQLLQKNIEIERLKADIAVTENSFVLQAENLKIYQDRSQNGQFTTTELNIQKAELQKLSYQLNQFREQLGKARIERVFILGKLSDNIKML